MEWNFDNDNFSVLNRADILISDFSGTMFDFSLVFDRPIIYTDVNLDRAPYDMAWHSGEIWETSVLPKLGTKLDEKDFDRLGDVISETIRNADLHKGIAQVRSECWEHAGESAKHEFDYLMKKAEELKK